MHGTYNPSEDYKHLPEDQLWITRYCGLIVERILMNACGRTCDTKRFSHRDICHDGRRAGTVKKVVFEAGYTVQRGTWEPKMPTVEAFVQSAPTKIPKFERATTAHDYETGQSPLDNIYHSYRKVTDLEPYELFYVYKHQHLFDIVVTNEKRTSSYSYEYDIDFEVGFYPKKDIPALQRALFLENLDHYCRFHICDVMQGTFGVDAKHLRSKQSLIDDQGAYLVDHGDDHAWLFFKENQNPDDPNDPDKGVHIRKRITETIHNIRHLQGVLSELLLLKKHTRGMTEETFKAAYMEKMPAYLMTMAPLYVMDENDMGKKTVATMLLKKQGTEGV